MSIGSSGGAVVTLLPALPDSWQVALPNAVVAANPGVPAEDLVFIRKLVVDAGGPVSRRIPRRDFELLVILSVEGIRIPEIRHREELVRDRLRDRINEVGGHIVVESRLAQTGVENGDP